MIEQGMDVLALGPEGEVTADFLSRTVGWLV